LPGRICKICADSRTVKRAAGLIAEGLPDQKIADRLGFPASAGRMLVSRHRRFHVEAPARALATVAGKGRATVEERERAVAAAEVGDVTAALLTLQTIVTNLRGVQERLERAAAGAEDDKQRVTIAALAAQQIRAIELSAKLGGIYAPPRSDAGGTNVPVVVRVERVFIGVPEIEPKPVEGTVINLDDFDRNIDDPANQGTDPIDPHRSR
jgi:hypothetical protein